MPIDIIHSDRIATKTYTVEIDYQIDKVVGVRSGVEDKKEYREFFVRALRQAADLLESTLTPKSPEYIDEPTDS